jgi:hypothetical protein
MRVAISKSRGGSKRFRTIRVACIRVPSDWLLA